MDEHIRFRLISLLAPVLQDEGVRALAQAYCATDAATVADGIAAFYRALAESGCDTAADYLDEKLLCADSTFARAAAAGDPAPFYRRADDELSLLRELVQTPCETLRDKLPESARAFCPVWKSGTFARTARSLADEYARGGYGAVRLSRALLFDKKTLSFVPVKNISPLRLTDLKEYEDEKAAAIANTVAFLQGKPANNVLLYGDRGTGKSSTVHALLNEYAPQGLRLLQLDKSAIEVFPVIKEKLARFPHLRFILFLDDLSFAEEDASFAALKAALEGSLATANNMRIYATTNRRHLVKESHADRAGDEVHAADAREESLSLFDRFGLVITYIAPDKREYVSILQQILRDRGIDMDDEQVALLAERYALRKGGRSPRAAKQLADLIESGNLPM